MKRQSEKMVAGGFILALLVLSGVATGSYWSVQKLIASRQAVEHTFEVLDALDRIFNSSSMIASGRYGYVISRQKAYLNDYKAGLQGSRQAIEAVRRLTSDDPGQQRQLTVLEQLIAKRTDLARRSIALLDSGQSNEAIQASFSNQSLPLSRQTRLVLAVMKDEERRLLAQRKQQTDESVHQAIVVNGVGYLLGFSLLMGVFIILYRQIRIRQRAEAALQKHSEEVSDLYNRAPCGYHSLDAAGIFIRINDTELDWLGYTRDEVVHLKHFAEMLTAQSVEVFQRNFPRFKEQGWLSDVEFEMIRNDGTILPVSLSATAIRDAEGNFVMSRSTLFDISDRKRAQAALQHVNEQLETRVEERTAALSQVNALLHSELRDRKQAEQALSESEKQLRTITDALPVLVSYVDADQRYRFNNKTYEQWYGHTQTELMGQPIRQVIGESAYQCIQPYLAAALSGQAITYESMMPYTDGGIRWINATYIPDVGARGNVRGFFALITDITDRKLAEAALRDSEQRLSLAIEGSGMATWDIDLQTGKALWSAQHFTLLGYEPVPSGEATLSMWQRSVHPDDVEWVMQAGERAIQTRSPYRSEHRIRRVDNGQIVWLAAFGRVVHNEAGQAVRFLGMILDITDRKLAEHALQQVNDDLEIKVQERTTALNQLNADLVRSNQELEQFAYIASHDLQEPLRAVMGYTQLLTQDYHDRLDDTAQGYGVHIVDGAKRMQQLIQDLLHYSRVGTRDLVFAPTDCNAVLEQVLGNLQVSIAERHAIITTDPLPTIKVDKLQLTQLFQNLIGNAIKFCRQEVPIVHISAKCVEEQGELGGQGEQGEQCKTQNLAVSGQPSAVSSGVNSKLKTSSASPAPPASPAFPHPSPLTPYPSPPLWLFSVRDNGIGIKPRYLERIFAIFKRLHTRTEFSGTGIGLAVCKKIVDRHGGRIWAESQPDNGTTFYFTLPHHDHSDVGLDRDSTD